MRIEARVATYAVQGQVLLHSLSAVFQAGRVTAILGPNGAGKSTLLSLLSGQHTPTSGRIWFNGQLMVTFGASRLALLRAVMAQDTAVAFDYTVEDVVGLGRFAHRRQPSANEAAIVPAAMAATGVSHLAGRILNSLSGGEKARAQLARALAQVWEPAAGGGQRWLLLDEPTAALDLAHQHHTMALVRAWAQSHGVGVIAVLHDVNLALRYADDVVVLERGRLVAEGPAPQVLVPALIRRVWQVGCEPTQSADGVAQYLFGR